MVYLFTDPKFYNFTFIHNYHNLIQVCKKSLMKEIKN